MVEQENIFTIADHPSVIGYHQESEKVEPIFNNCTNSKLEYLRIKNENASYRYIQLLKNENLIDNVTNYALVNAKNFFTKPSPDCIKAIDWILVDIEQNHSLENARKLASPLTTKHILRLIRYALMPNKYAFVDVDHAWYLGSAAISGKLTRYAFNFFYYGHKFFISIKSYLALKM